MYVTLFIKKKDVRVKVVNYPQIHHAENEGQD